MRCAKLAMRHRAAAAASSMDFVGGRERLEARIGSVDDG
jgi:hypothetical protein